MKVLVTGGEGVVGKHLVRELRGKGHEVTSLDRIHAAGPSYYRADVGEYRQLAAVVRETKPEIVFHAAAEFGRWNGEDFFETLWRSNAVGTKNVLVLAKEHGFRSVVFSSSEVYGDFEGVMGEPVMDKVAIKQMNDYAITKWVNEMQALNHDAMHGTETVRIRIFNTYGPGEYFSTYRSVICRFVYSVLLGQPLTVYRGHHRTSTYITDATRAIAAIADNFRPGEVYNIASDDYHSIEEAAELVVRAAGADPSLIRYQDAEPFTTKDKKVDNERAKRDLGMRTRVRLAEGIPNTVAWMRKELCLGS